MPLTGIPWPSDSVDRQDRASIRALIVVVQREVTTIRFETYCPIAVFIAIDRIGMYTSEQFRNR